MLHYFCRAEMALAYSVDLLLLDLQLLTRTQGVVQIFVVDLSTG